VTDLHIAGRFFERNHFDQFGQRSNRLFSIPYVRIALMVRAFGPSSFVIEKAF
jgi:hypothetical protein